MFKSAVDDLEILTGRLQEKTKELKRSCNIPDKYYKDLTVLSESFINAVKTLNELSEEYNSFLLQLSPADVGLPGILHQQKFGSGSFGDVYPSKLTGVKVAVKLMKEKKGSTEQDQADFENEIRTLRLLRHDNIVAYRGSGTYDKRLFVVMEFIKDTLADFIISRSSDDNSGLTAFLSWHISGQIAKGLAFLHSHEITHRDIKPDNILLDTAPIHPVAKLCDFGLSQKKRTGNFDKNPGHVRYNPKAIDEQKGAVRTKAQKKDQDDTKTKTQSAPKPSGSGDPEVNLPLSKMQSATPVPTGHDDPEMSFERAKRIDVFGFGLVVLAMRTGKKPWQYHNTQELEKSEISERVVYQTTKSWYIRDIKVADVAFGNELGELVKACCASSSVRPTFDAIMRDYFALENPYKMKETKGEFFSCGFLKNTNIFVVDSVDVEGEAPGQPTYSPDNLLCGVDVCPSEKFMPRDKTLRKQFKINYKKYIEKSKPPNREIDNNPTIALKEIITDRAGEDEAQRIRLKFVQSTYCMHRAMRDIWRSFDETEKIKEVPCKSEVHKLYSTSFGLHVALLTKEKDGTKKFVFTQRATKAGIASPGAYTCGAVESCSVLDYNTNDGKTASVSLLKTAARGLNEELGLPLNEDDMKAIHLNTVYLKFDNHEWGMCGFVDLSDPRICEENQFSYDRLTTAFTSGPKDKFEHSRIEGVEFDLSVMVAWIREHHREMASSAKIAVVKVLQAYFGTSAVTKEFEKFE